ncbi:helix-turn-helix transcriptional regulator [Actinoplanes sp. NBRC 101535]|uniref:helix-turn-helix domain-containing protein n=1 Tax=Actinoplanes sp. NBRC 101535 TaxID=3032196 RepID=UPI00255646B3|nr:helix-turn-helix transcriptional regulator [Actinoplanes sp. NBRC 101535]
METFGSALRRHREARGLSLRALGRAALIDPGHLTRIERGTRPPPAMVTVELIDKALGTGGELAAILSPPWIRDGGLWRPDDAERLSADLVANRPTAENASRLAHQWLLAESPQVTESRAGRRIGMGMVRKVQKRVKQLRLLDDHVGGSHTYAMVTAELAATIGLLRDWSYPEEVGRRLLVAVGELAQLAGWTSSDAGRYAQAERIYLIGMRAAHAGGDAALAANNLSSLAYQFANVGRATHALDLARSAYAGARHSATPKTRALLAERVAWAAAQAGDVKAADTALVKVEKDYASQKATDVDPHWVYWLSTEEVEVMAGRVWTQTRRPIRAVPILERAIEGYGDDTGRETALYQSWMAESLEQANEPDRAAAAALKSLRLSRRAGSVRADDRVVLLRRKLRKHAGNEAVDAFLDESRSTGQT